ncbi:MAG: CHAD domain-containing protein, partial [Acidimicrobiales bacterium]
GDPGGDGVLSRDEITVEGDPGAPPAAITSLVTAFRRGAELIPVADIQTLRRTVKLCDADGREVARIDDDDVTVRAGEEVTARFREIEVELTGPSVPSRLLDDVVSRLRRAGAGKPDPTPKVVRALGPGATAPPDLAPVELGHDPSAADVLRAGLVAAVNRIVEHDPVIRLDRDPEGVHQARVGLRRLRSDLRTYRPLVDRDWSEPLRDELRWLADELGAVRDRDVMLDRMRDGIHHLGKADAEHADWLVAQLERERAEAQRALLVVLDASRYAELLDRLVDAARHPHLLAGASAPAGTVLPGLAARPWRKLRKAVKALGDHPGDDALHQVRIRVKRARYAADVAVPVVGDRASRYAKKLAALQDVLGDLHDAVVAEARLREAAAGARRAQALVVGQLIAQQRASAETSRARWPKKWRRVDRKKVTGWLS